MFWFLKCASKMPVITGILSTIINRFVTKGVRFQHGSIYPFSGNYVQIIAHFLSLTV